jgi:hypothetical protein
MKQTRLVFGFTSWILVIDCIINLVSLRLSLTVTKHLIAYSLSVVVYLRGDREKCIFFLGIIWSQRSDKRPVISRVFCVCVLSYEYIVAVWTLWTLVHGSVMSHNNCRLLGEVLSLKTMSTLLYDVYSHQMPVEWYHTTHSLHQTLRGDIG